MFIFVVVLPFLLGRKGLGDGGYAQKRKGLRGMKEKPRIISATGFACW